MWPFETLMIFTGRPNVGTFSQLSETEKVNLAKAMKKLCTRYDNLFKCNFPYAMGFQTKPNCEKEISDNLGWQLHAHYFPPLLRSSTVKGATRKTKKLTFFRFPSGFGSKNVSGCPKKIFLEKNPFFDRPPKISIFSFFWSKMPNFIPWTELRVDIMKNTNR